MARALRNRIRLALWEGRLAHLPRAFAKQALKEHREGKRSVCDDTCVAIGSPILSESVREHRRRENGIATTRRQVIVKAMAPREVRCRSVRRRTQAAEGILVATICIYSGAWMSQKVLQKMATLSRI